MPSIVESLQRRAFAGESTPLYSWLEDGDRVTATLGARELDRLARHVAGALLRRLAPGDPVLLAFPAGLPFVVSFFGCLYAGLIAIPAYPPEGKGRVPRLATIVQDAGARLVLTTETRSASTAEGLSELGASARLPVEVYEALVAEPGPLSGDLRSDPHAVALLQYTSGSTGEPKGVMVSHGNISANLAAIAELARLGPNEPLLSWLPHYHDMGLIAGILQGTHTGFPTYLMSPLAFIQKPQRLLKAITKYRIGIALAPNFAYARCVERVKPPQRAELDLRSWRIAQCGAEPIRKETFDRFCEAFGPYGFRAEAFFPGYGLAEATLMVSSTFVGEGRNLTVDRAALKGGAAVVRDDEAADTQTIVSCGRVASGHRVLIVDPEAKTVAPEGTVGEIWIAGPSVARGYWNKPEPTRETFGAHTCAGDGPFLRTGDLGFVRDGELYVTGRIKELVIVNGQNHYPQDIERTVESAHAAFRVSCGAVFAVEHRDTECVVLVHEVDFPPVPDAVELGDAARRAVADKHEITIAAVVLVKPGGVPKTSSGKTMRRACRDLFLAGALKPLGTWAALAEFAHLVAPYRNQAGPRAP